MSATVVVHALFPHDGAPRAAKRPLPANRLGHLLSVAFALVPLVVMGHVLGWTG